MSKKRILIVDDAKDILFLLMHSVKRLGPDYEVSTVTDAFAALDQVEKQKFDVIITDYMMPRMTGIDLVQAVRQISPETQIVLMTAHDTKAVRNAEAIWEGNLKEGHGTVKVGSGAFEGPYTYKSRFEEGPGTNPEELIGAAHAGCFSMFLSAVLSKAGHTVKRVQTTAKVHLGTVDGAATITKIELDTVAEVPGLDETTFREHAEASKKGCPVSKALTGTEVVLNAKLIS